MPDTPAVTNLGPHTFAYGTSCYLKGAAAVGVAAMVRRYTCGEDLSGRNNTMIK